MRFVVNSQYFAQELRLLDKIVSPKLPQQVLKNILFVADVGGLAMTTTDLEVGLKTTCDAQITEGGICTLPSSKLMAIVEQLPNCDIEVFSKGDHVFLNAGMFKSRIQTLPPEDFPTVPDVEGTTLTMPLLSLQKLIARTRYAIADRGAKFGIDGAMLMTTEDRAIMVATNGSRLSLTGLPLPNVTAQSMVIPSKTMDTILAIVEQGDVVVSSSDNHLFFSIGQRLIYSRKMEAKFPDFKRAIPKGNDKIVTASRSQFAAVLRRVGMMSEDKILGVTMQVSNNLITLNTRSADMGDAEEELVVKYEGENLKLQANWKFILDFLEAASGDTITMSLKDDANTPILLTDGEDFLNAVSTMRFTI